MSLRAVLAGIMGLALMAGTAFAANAATEYGKSLPPVGFVRFCVDNPADCKSLDDKYDRLAISPERWNLVYQVNSYVNNKIAPVSDEDLYGEVEHWAYPTDAGDCEDYVLLKKRYLENLGFSAEALLITVVLDEKGDGHAVLTITTEDGDYILDNRRNDVKRWNNTGYKFLKRQSHSNPLQWVALVKQTTKSSGFVASGN
jgi:predicted transglutaminase-like cysteine proteinase